ncbi:hypothetical protein ACI2LM_13295 [Paenibacillus lautus]|uniref:hypothetical protein n=1 Tax=Paenibacillus lautus TaxID=1401 RepID=UPI00384C13C0
MIGKAKEIFSDLIDARELNQWLEDHPESEVLQIQLSSAGTSAMGIVPSVLIIYK